MELQQAFYDRDRNRIKRLIQRGSDKDREDALMYAC